MRNIPGPPPPAQPARLTLRHKLTCPSESPQHPTPPFPITLIIADHRSHAFLLELLRPLCSLVTHPDTYEHDYLFRSYALSFLSDF